MVKFLYQYWLWLLVHHSWCNYVNVWHLTYPLAFDLVRNLTTDPPWCPILLTVHISYAILVIPGNGYLYVHFSGRIRNRSHLKVNMINALLDNEHQCRSISEITFNRIYIYIYVYIWSIICLATSTMPSKVPNTRHNRTKTSTNCPPCLPLTWLIPCPAASMFTVT